MNATPTDTPRTNAARFRTWINDKPVDCVFVSEAEQLERELASAKQDADELATALDVAYACSKSATNDLELNTLQKTVIAALAKWRNRPTP